MNILLTVSYDGTNYAGWQRQKNAIAVQQRLEEALTGLLKAPIALTAASRTDAGVHALGQRASFIVEHMPIPLEKLPQTINGCLPGDIAVCNAVLVPDDFNPRFSAQEKTYCYQLYNALYPNPLLARYSAFVPQDLNTAKMAAAAAHFVGTHNFAAFCASGSNVKSTERTVFACDVKQKGPLIKMHITGDGFLYNMVRIITGTIMYTGLGKILPGDIPAIIASCDRTKAGKTMPPEGLTLVEVVY